MYMTEMVKVELSGEIDDQARVEIINFIYSRHRVWLGNVDFGGWELVNRRGKIAKRIAANLKKRLNLKLTGKEMEWIGNRANAGAPQEPAYYIEIHDRLADMQRGEFGDGDSCFYGGKSHHRLLMGLDGRFTVMLVYDREKEPMARAWIFNPPNGAMVLFNVYGLDGRLAARLLSAHRGLPITEGDLGGDVWINRNASWIVGAEDGQTSYMFTLGTSRYRTCWGCKAMISKRESRECCGHDWCSDCYANHND